VSTIRGQLRPQVEGAPRAERPSRKTKAMKFMLMMNAPRGNGDWGVMNWATEELKAHIRFMKDLVVDLKKEGVLVGAEGLAPPGQARVVRASKSDQSPEVTDGPFAEAKEFLAGYWIVDVESPAQAYAIAARASTAPGPGGKPMYLAIEVREVMSAPPVDG
jgi:hypothetical protein